MEAHTSGFQIETLFLVLLRNARFVPMDEMRMYIMARSSIIELPVENFAATTDIYRIDPRVSAETRAVRIADEDQPRHIPYKAALALEILGHAIEYLSEPDECEGTAVAEARARLEAVHLLMSLNRTIYFACPPVRSFRERWHSFIHLSFLHPGQVRLSVDRGGVVMSKGGASRWRW
jgi:hypothetical protein